MVQNSSRMRQRMMHRQSVATIRVAAHPAKHQSKGCQARAVTQPSQVGIASHAMLLYERYMTTLHGVTNSQMGRHTRHQQISSSSLHQPR